MIAAKTSHSTTAMGEDVQTSMPSLRSVVVAIPNLRSLASPGIVKVHRAWVYSSGGHKGFRQSYVPISDFH